MAAAVSVKVLLKCQLLVILCLIGSSLGQILQNQPNFGPNIQQNSQNFGQNSQNFGQNSQNFGQNSQNFGASLQNQQKFRPRLINRKIGRVGQVLPPVSQNPQLVPNELRNKPPSVHVNFFPEITTTEKNYYPNYVPNVPKIPESFNIPDSLSVPDVPKISQNVPKTNTKVPKVPDRPKIPNRPDIYERLPELPKQPDFAQTLPKIPKFPKNFRLPPPSTESTNLRPVTVDFARPSYNRRNDEKINLNTDYFIKKTEIRKVLVTTTSRPESTSRLLTTRRKRRLTTVKPSRIPVLVKKIAKVPKNSKKSKIGKKKNKNDLCDGILECAGINGQFEKSVNDTKKNYVVR